MEPTDKEYLIQLAELLDNAERLGADVDEPEGARWIEIPLAKQIAVRLRAIVEGWDSEREAVMDPSDKGYLAELAAVLDDALPPRRGADIEFSDVLARQVGSRLRAIVSGTKRGDCIWCGGGIVDAVGNVLRCRDCGAIGDLNTGIMIKVDYPPEGEGDCG